MKVAVIGCGVMGSALARHFSKKHPVILSDRTCTKSAALAKELGGEVYLRQIDAIEKADLIILAVKPKDLKLVAKEIGGAFRSNQIVVSVLAGTPLKLLHQYFLQAKIIRAMPNLALTCGEGVIGFVDTPELSSGIKDEINTLFQGLGLLVWLSEEKLEGVSALAGSGPAFIFVLIEAMIDSGIALGFTQAESKELVLKTLEGAIKLLRETGSSPAELKWKVTSPGGTTIAGLKVLERGAIRGVLMETFQATYLKAEELQKGD